MAYQATLINRLSQFNSTTFDVVLVDNSGAMPDFRSSLYFSGLTPGTGVIIPVVSGLIRSQTLLYLSGVLIDNRRRQLSAALVIDAIDDRCFALQQGIISRLSGIPMISGLKISWSIPGLDINVD